MANLIRETGRGFASSLTANSSLSNSTVETTLFSQTISGGKMGTSKALKFTLYCSLTTPALAVPTLTVKVKLGSTSLTVMSGLSLAISQTNAPFNVTGLIVNKSAPNAQFTFSQIIQQSASIPLVLTSALADADWTVDTTTDQLFAVTAQFGSLNATTTLTFRYADIELT